MPTTFIFVVFVMSAPSKGGATGSEEKDERGRRRSVERVRRKEKVNRDSDLFICKLLLILIVCEAPSEVLIV